MLKSVYERTETNAFIAGSKTIELTEDERIIIANALAMVAPKEVDIIPLLVLADKICSV